MADRLLYWREVAKVVPYSRMHVGRLEKRGEFPRRVELTPGGRIAWRASEVEQWLNSRPSKPLNGSAET